MTRAWVRFDLRRLTPEDTGDHGAVVIDSIHDISHDVSRSVPIVELAVIIELRPAEFLGPPNGLGLKGQSANQLEGLPDGNPTINRIPYVELIQGEQVGFPVRVLF